MSALHEQPKLLPIPVSNLDMAFGGGDVMSKLLPPMSAIPEEFKRDKTYWNKMVSKWFFSGAKVGEFTAKPGIDKNSALRHLQTCLGSFEPKHEHKEAGVAYLMSLWFEEPSKP